MDTSKYFICELCTKKYKHRQSLYKHNCLSVSQKSPSGHPEVSKSHPNVDCNESSLFESTCEQRHLKTAQPFSNVRALFWSANIRKVRNPKGISSL